MLVVVKNRWGSDGGPEATKFRFVMSDLELLYSADLVIYDTAQNTFTIMRGVDPPEVLKVHGSRRGLSYRDK